MPPTFRILATFMALAIHHASADVVTINPSADTCLFELDPNHNWGSQDEVVAGTLRTGEKARALVAFDIAGHVPAGSTVTSVRLTLRVVRTPPGPANSNFHLLRVLVPWVEGTKSSVAGAGNAGGALATSGETTWLSRLHQMAAWNQPGGQLEVEFAEDPSGTQFVGGDGNKVFVFTTDGVSDVQSMLDSPGGNHGWVLVTENEAAAKSARRWASRQHPTNPPKLEITFTPPPAPEVPEIINFQYDPITGSITVDVQGLAGTTYTLETRQDLVGGTWGDVDTQAVTSDGLLTLNTSAPSGARKLFFRVTARLTP